MKPEEIARQQIDEMLTSAGWVVQDRDKLNLGAGPGIAIREFSLSSGSADYLLLVDREAVGVVEAKPAHYTLQGVREQSAKYLSALDAFMPARRPLPFHYETTGIQTYFTSHLDPIPRSRLVFHFHTPSMLREWLALAPENGENRTLRARLLHMPELVTRGLYDCQVTAITNLERSLREQRPRALIQMATGSGKTYTAVNFIYRLIRYAGARRVLFLVDRDNLGQQTFNEFQRFVAPDDGRKFTELYNVQHLQGRQIDGVARVCITNIQRLYSLLKGEAAPDDAGESLFALEEAEGQQLSQEVRHVAYNPQIPIDTFDIIVTDECHRSIYHLWREVLEYFDAFLIGLTATPNKQTFGFFQQNLVMEYGHAQAVADGVNVDYLVYDIHTRITEQGSKIEKDFYIDKRDRRTRRLRWEQASDDITYSAEQLDRDVVSPDQIRTVLRAFKDALFTDLFPERGKGGHWQLSDVPKTLIFAKDDSHADDITEMVMDVFGAGNNFVQKITYRTTGRKPEELISEFRNNPFPRIAVTVDMISTGTDIKPLEILLFMRKVKSAGFFEQMKGRGTRVIDSEAFAQVTPNVAAGKTHFVLVDAVGVYESAKSDEPTLDREPRVPLRKVLDDVALGRWRRDPNLLSTLMARLGRLQQRLRKPGMERSAAQIRQSAGKDLHAIITELAEALNPDTWQLAAQEATGEQEPGQKALAEARTRLAQAALLPFDNPDLRAALLAVQARDEQVIDTISRDELLTIGWNVQAREAARATVSSFRDYLVAHKDEITALQIFFSQPRRTPLTEEMVNELAAAIQAPPLGLTSERLWQAYEALDPARVRQGANPRRTLADLVALLRYTMVYESDAQATLEPYSEIVARRFADWLSTQEARRGQPFDAEQRHWLTLIRDTIASSLTIEQEDFRYGPLAQQGGWGRANRAFNGQLRPLLDDLNQELAA
jgi:type I restriction enzyme R subunit